MKSLLLTIGLLTFTLLSYSQNIYQIRADSVRIYSDCDTAEFILENHTQMVPGYLYNKGRGRTEFRRMRFIDLGLGLIAIGDQDTLNFGNSSLGNQFIQNQFSTAQIADYWIKGRSRVDGMAMLGMYKNNETEDSVLTTDVNGNVKLKLAGMQDAINSITINLPGYMSGGGTKTGPGSITYNVGFFNQSGPGGAGVVFASPAGGGSGALSFRPLAAGDIPNLPASKLTSGLVATARLGTGTVSSLTWLRGDQTWASLTASDVGAAPSNNGTGYIQNQTTTTQTAAFKINGTSAIVGSASTALRVGQTGVTNTNYAGIILDGVNGDFTGVDYLHLYQQQNGDAFLLNNNPNGNLIFSAGGGVERLRITPSGNVGIGTNAPMSTLQVIGSVGMALNTVTTSTTLNTTQHTILVNNSANVTITLPAASTCAGRVYVIKKISNNAFTVSIETDASENIEGSSAPQIINTYLNSFTIQCDGTSWWIL